MDNPGSLDQLKNLLRQYRAGCLPDNIHVYVLPISTQATHGRMENTPLPSVRERVYWEPVDVDGVTFIAGYGPKTRTLIICEKKTSQLDEPIEEIARKARQELQQILSNQMNQAGRNIEQKG